jgi:subtilase family serine protease
MAIPIGFKRPLAIWLATAVAMLAMAMSGPAVRTAAAGGLHPFATDHIVAKGFNAPLTTADCQSMFGINCYLPAQIQRAYDLGPLFNRGLNGRGRTIVIVDAFGSPTIANDLAVFDKTLGLPAPPSFKILTPEGPVPPCSQDPFGAGDCEGWGVETSLDVEWSHVMAPGANIVLVETPASETEGIQGFPEIVAAENWVINHGVGDVISQSFGATEETFANPGQILSLRSAYINARAHGVTVLGSSGDAGATDYESDLSTLYPYRVTSWPSSDPLVTSVGGTQLSLDGAGKRTAPDVVWNDGFGAGGGGVSAVFARPQFQNGVRGVVGQHRGTPDISLSAAVNGAVNIFDSSPGWDDWDIVGGTSEASPLFAGVIAIADQIAKGRVGWINPALYRMGQSHAAENGIVDITSGNNSFAGVTGYSAGRGYDLASGWGTVDVARFAPALAEASDR